MNDSKAIKKFLELRDNLWSEMHNIEERMNVLGEELAQLDARHTELQQILDGSPQGLELLEKEEDETPAEIGEPTFDQMLVTFIASQPGGATRAEMNEHMREWQDAPHQVEKAVKRLKRRDVIYREGATRNSTWHVVA